MFWEAKVTQYEQARFSGKRPGTVQRLSLSHSLAEHPTYTLNHYLMKSFGLPDGARKLIRIPPSLTYASWTCVPKQFH